MTSRDKENYISFLQSMNFNEAQIELIVRVKEEYDGLPHRDAGYVDGWERDQWYTFNRSGLFEGDDEDNKTHIDDWTQSDTREYITEY